MSGKKVVIITGGNSGLGFECARNIAKFPEYTIVLACRNMAKAEHAKAHLIECSGNPDILSMEVDISSLSSVRAFAENYKKHNLPLYGLVCNAGINGINTGVTDDRLDIIFETNHLGHFLLTNLLLPLMLPSGRIAVVSSDMHDPPGQALIWPGSAALAHPDGLLAGSMLRYSYSKLCNLYFTYELTRRLKSIGSKITVNALNPGLMTDTNFAPDKSRFTEAFLQQISDRLGSLSESGEALAEIITQDGLASVSGKYFDRDKGIADSSLLSQNKANALELWNISVKLADLTRDETPSWLL